MWWMIVLYVFVALGFFRFAYLDYVDTFKRLVHENDQRPMYSRKSQQSIKNEKLWGLVVVIVYTVNWPLFAIGYLLYKGITLLAKGVFKVLFPRGVVTKFDREQQLEREKQEAQRKYHEAKELLAQEGITVE